MYNGYFRTLGRPSVPSKTKNSHIKMKSLSKLMETINFTTQTIMSDSMTKTFQKRMSTNDRLKNRKEIHHGYRRLKMKSLPMVLVQPTLQLLQLEIVMKNDDIAKTGIRFPRIGRVRIVQPLD